MLDLIIEYIGIIGSFAFAISGALTAMKKKLDPFGILIIAFVSAVGGGTVRDILLKDKEVFWIVDGSYHYFILAGTITAILLRERLWYFKKHLLIFDTVGLGIFTISGVQIGVEYDLSVANCLILGTLTGAFGGVLRDVLVNEVPVVFRQEIYATICVLGGCLYFILESFKLNGILVQLSSIFFIIILRLLVVYFKVSFPPIILKRDRE